MRISDVTRQQAFLTHLLVSTCIFIVISYLIVFHWYPEFYFFIDGGVRGIVTIFFVDVVLGPGLTLLVFKPGKKTLKFDMAIILILQFSALVWGIKSVYTERPATTVFYWGKFSCIAHKDAGEIDLQPIKAGPSGRQRLSILLRPDTIDERYSFTKEAFDHQTSEIYYYGSKILPLDKDRLNRMDKYELDLEELRKLEASDADRVEAFIGSTAISEPYKLIPLACRYGNAIAVYDPRQLRIVDTLDVSANIRANALDIDTPANVTVEIIKPGEDKESQ
jgi:hypothetical protein